MAGEMPPGSGEVSPGLQAYNEAVVVTQAALQQQDANVVDMLAAVQAQQEAGVELLEDHTLGLGEFASEMRAAYLAINRQPVQLIAHDIGFVKAAIKNYGAMNKRAADFPWPRPLSADESAELASETSSAEATKDLPERVEPEPAESEASPAAAAPSPRTDLTRQDTSKPKP